MPIERKAQANSDAFARIVHEHKRTVFAVAYGKLRNAHEAEDIMQDVFLEAYRNLHRLKKPERIGAWLYKAVVYRCVDHIRKSARREKRELTFAESLANNPATNPATESDDCDRIIKAIESLPEKYRTVVMLKHFAHLSYGDIAEMTGLSRTVIGTRLQTARGKLKDKLVSAQKGAD